MRVGKNAIIILSVAAASWVTVGVVLGTGTLSGAHTNVPPSGASPACLRSTGERSAALAGTAIDVSPAPGTDTADPHTQISFLGTPADALRNVSAEGSHSGRHTGQLVAYSQGDGVSFVLSLPFDAGEQVRVSALIGPPGRERPAAFGFRVATGYPTAGIPAFPNPPAPASSYQSFVSAPGLHPPILQVTAKDRDAQAGDVLMTVGPGPGQYGPLIYHPDGRLVWFKPLPKGIVAENLSVQRYEGQDVLTWWQGRVYAFGFGQGEDVVMDRNYETVARVRAGNGYEADLHDFQIAPGNVAYLTIYNLMRCDLSHVGGARNGAIVDTAVQAVDMKSGLVRWEWHSLDHAEVSESQSPATKSATPPWDLFHMNSVDPQPDGNLLISSRTTWTLYEVQRGTGVVMWRLGGNRSSFAMGTRTQTAWQHDGRMHGGQTVTLFDNGSNPRVHYQSRALRLTVDTARHRVSLAREFAHPGGPLLADSQGNVQTLGDGGTVIGWGAIPSVTELGQDGSLLFDAHLPAGSSSYRAFRFPWAGQPLWAPAASARLLTTGDSTTVFASWNGASGVAYWRVLAGPHPDSLTARATMPDSGFESSITFPDAYAYVAVQALGPSRQLLGTSPTVSVQQPAAPPKGG